MSRIDRESPGEKPRLHVVGFGGTIMSVPHQREDSDEIILKPRPESLARLVASLDPQVRDLLHDELEQTPRHDLFDSAKARADIHIIDIVENIRHKLKEGNADAFVILYGTDTMTDMITALGSGISKKELGDKSIIAACSMHHLDAPNSDAYLNFERAAMLASMQEVRGRIGLCVDGKRFVPPRGVEKIGMGAKFPFASRFRRMAKFSAEENQWIFDRKPAPYDEPRREHEKEFNLVMGVECIELTSTSSYNSLRRLLQNKGTVIKAPGNGNFRTDPNSEMLLRRAVRKAGGPVIVVGQGIQNADLNRNFDEMYEGDASRHEQSRLMSGGLMTASEARIFLSQCLAEAQKKRETFNGTIEFVRSQLALYPFRDAKGSTWQPIEENK